MVPDGFRKVIQWLAALFYADNGFLAFPRPARLQKELHALEGMFGSIDIQNNVNKTLGVVCQSYYMSGSHSEVSYLGRMTGVGLSFRGFKQ